MNEKINIAEILKDCPKGMELYSPLCGKCVFDRISSGTIICTKQNNQNITFTSEGYYMLPVFDNCECMIFPSKENRDWSTFQRPFKDGDVVINASNKESNAFIYKGMDNYHYKMYVGLTTGRHPDLVNGSDAWVGIYRKLRFATEEEKQKLFDAIKANGYKWNAETKTLEKLNEPKFKVGDVIQDIDTYKVKITEVNIEDECYGYESMIVKGIGSIDFSEQDNWVLVPNKFDITTLKPFESRVLVRNVDGALWKPAIYGFSHSKGCYVVGGGYWEQFIPYEANKELLGTTNNPKGYGSE